MGLSPSLKWYQNEDPNEDPKRVILGSSCASLLKFNKFLKRSENIRNTYELRTLIEDAVNSYLNNSLSELTVKFNVVSDDSSEIMPIEVRVDRISNDIFKNTCLDRLKELMSEKDCIIRTVDSYEHKLREFGVFFD